MKENLFFYSYKLAQYNSQHICRNITNIGNYDKIFELNSSSSKKGEYFCANYSFFFIQL